MSTTKYPARSTPDYVQEYFGTHTDLRVTRVFVSGEGWCPVETTNWTPVGDQHEPGAPATWDVFDKFHADGVQDFEVTGTKDTDGYERTAVADFRYAELVKHAQRPFFTGRLA